VDDDQEPAVTGQGTDPRDEAPAPGGRAELLLTGGKVRMPGGFADAIALAGGRVLAVGSAADIAETAGPGTRVIDLRGRLAIPAFGDAHVHAVGGGLDTLRCNLLGVRTRAACLDAIAGYAASLPADAWVLGSGWPMEAFPGGVPAAADLDSVCGGRPAFLPNKDHHSAWVSSAALALAGLDADTPDPPDGRIERDQQGRPTGALHDGAMTLVGRLVPAPSAAELDAALDAAQRYLHSLGITHWQDACVGDVPELGVADTYEAYRRASADGRLTATVVGALWWDRVRGIGQLGELLARREAAASGAFRATTVKMMLDGICETFTAAMSEPYLDGPDRRGSAGQVGSVGHGHSGSLFVEPEAVADAVRSLDGEGFQVHFHAIGDRAVSVALNALQGLAPASRAAGRHHVAHLQFIRPDDLGRFRALGVTANFQPLWACSDPQMLRLTLPYVGPERAGWQYRIGSVLASGARVAFGSDWPVSSPDPLQEIHVAVNRVLSGRLGESGTEETEEPFLPAEAISVAAAVDAFTRGVAYVNHDDGAGELRPGMRGDVAVLDQDIFTVPPAQIGQTSVVLTVAAGQVVHGDE
jgi:predicted amidohydrolase YtcJ